MNIPGIMKYFLPILFATIILLSTVYSCKKEKEQAAMDMGYAYFPDKQGDYIVYDVDSFFYNDFTDHIDTFKFQLKEKIESFFSDNENRPTMRLEQYIRLYDPKKPYSSIPWKLRNVWTANRTVNTAEKIEENVRFVKLIFPVTAKASWNGNAKNNLGHLNYSYYSVDLPATINNTRFDSVLQVTQQDDLTLISKKYYIEKYARNYGMIFKHVIDVESQPDPTWPDSVLFKWRNTPIMDRVDFGIQYIVKFNSYGHE
ncbi:MAG TPA: hypothetical protein PLL00_03030 [Bacteroidia bacterium]|nr:hypothetical protein [Bacteroidia bacterium]